MRTLGLSYTDLQLIRLTYGASIPMTYAEVGFMYAELWHKETGNRIGHVAFSKELLRTCEKGLICWKDADQVFENFRDRRFTTTARGLDALRAYNITCGGDYSYNKYFKGEENLNKYLKNKVVFEGSNSKNTRQINEVFQQHNSNPEALRKAE